MFTCWYQSAVTHTWAFSCVPLSVWGQKPLQAHGCHPASQFTGTQTTDAPCWPKNQETERLPGGKFRPGAERWVPLKWSSSNVTVKQSNPSTHTLSPGSVVQTGPLMGVVFAAFVMGVSLMAGLWCIYHHTGNEVSFLLSLKTYTHYYMFCYCRSQNNVTQVIKYPASSQKPLHSLSWREILGLRGSQTEFDDILICSIVLFLTRKN